MRRFIFFFLSAFAFTLPAIADEIIEAHFIAPTERYDHCALGDCTEYGGIEARLKDGRTMSLLLPGDSVFEDISPRLVPLGLNGRPALLVIRSYMGQGAALSLLGIRRGKLDIVAESDPIGTAHRWQNPIGVADFDRDGVPEIASVLTPHIGGELTLFERKGTKLRVDKTLQTFSNHKFGSDQLDLAEIMDWNDDGIMDIVLPNVSRTEMMAVTFANQDAEIIARQKFPFLIDGPITGLEGGVEFTLSDGNKEHWFK